MKVCINEECHYHHWDLSSRNCSRWGLGGDIRRSYFSHCEWRIDSEDEAEKIFFYDPPEISLEIILDRIERLVERIECMEKTHGMEHGMEANRKERCDFDVTFKGEKWHIEMAWIKANGEVAWYDGGTYRDGMKVMRIFSPSEIDVPKTAHGM